MQHSLLFKFPTQFYKYNLHCIV